MARNRIFAPAIRATCYGMTAALALLLSPADTSAQTANQTSQPADTNASPPTSQQEDPERAMFAVKFNPPLGLSGQRMRDVLLLASMLEIYTADIHDPNERYELAGHYAGLAQTIGVDKLLNLDKWPLLENARRDYLLKTLVPDEWLTVNRQHFYAIAINALFLNKQYPPSYHVADKRAVLPARAKAPKYVSGRVFYH